MITREDQVEQSVSDFVKEGVAAFNYDSVVHLRDAFPSADERAEKLEKTTIAVGFNFDDGGRHIELGSDLTLRTYTIEFWVFGLTAIQGRNVANLIRAIVEQGNYLIPLKAIQDPGTPVFDQLVVSDERGVTVTRQLANNPRVWDRYVWTAVVRVEDTYMPSQALVVDN